MKSNNTEIGAQSQAGHNDSGEDSGECDEAQKTGRTPERTSYHPVDSGWSWVVLLSVFTIQFVCAGLLRSFGVLFVAIQLRFQSSASTISALGALESVSFSITALLCMFVVLELVSVRLTTLTGSMVGVGGLVGCYLAKDITLIIPCFSVAIGIAFGLTMGPGFVLLNAYFKHKLPLATAVANTGGSIGSVVMPIALRMLLDEFFLSGAFLILGGIFAQMLVFGSLLTPPDDYKLRNASHQENGVSAEDKKMETIQQQRLLAKRMRRKRNCQKTVSESEVVRVRQDQETHPAAGVKPLTQSLLSINDRIIRQNRHDRPTTRLQGSTNALILTAGVCGSHTISLSTLDLNSSFFTTNSRLLHDLLNQKDIEKVTHSYDCRIQELNDKPISGCKMVSKKLSSMCDPALFRSMVFWLLAVYHYLGGLVCGLPAAYIPALAQEKGLSTTQGALLLTIAGGLDILSKLVPGILAQSRLVKPQTSVMLSLVVLGMLFQLTVVAEGMVALTVISVIYGLFSGVFFSMLPLIILDFNDISRFRQVFGFTQLSMGICGVTGFPIIGYLKDTSGSYVTSFHYMGACGLLAAVLLLLMPVLQRRQAARTASSNPPVAGRSMDDSV